MKCIQKVGLSLSSVGFVSFVYITWNALTNEFRGLSSITPADDPDVIRSHTLLSRIHNKEVKHDVAAANIWDTTSGDDRILSQLNYIPLSLQGKNQSKVSIKTIFLDGGLWPGLVPGYDEFIKQQCTVHACFITPYKESWRRKADAVIYPGFFELPPRTSHSQIWILYQLESPPHSNFLYKIENVFNWTATYRRDSTIVTPYVKWVPYYKERTKKLQYKNYAANKTKKVAWFVSNCAAENGRLEYATQLARYIQVDIFGTCGTLRCNRHNPKCWKILDKSYKFYLSFENSNCKDYITEKFFENGLGHDILPIVMGARAEEYRQVAPPDSFIHVDDFKSPADLAAYLHVLDKDDKLYNKYFEWKGTGEYINTKFWCRVCALLHDDRPPVWIPDPDAWWSTVCTRDRWT